MMQLGICTISAKSRSVESVVELAGELEVDGVEIWGKDHLGSGTPERCREIASVAAASGVAVPVYGSYLRPGGDDFDETLDQELTVADELGSDLIRVWAGEQEYQDCDDAYFERVVRDLERLAKAAEEKGLGVTVERHVGTVTNRTVGAETLIETIDSPAVGLNWQPLFEHGETEVTEDARRLASLANNVHVQAVPAPGETDRCALSDAYFDVADVLGAFADAGFDGFVEIEFVTDAVSYRTAVADDVAFLRDLL